MPVKALQHFLILTDDIERTKDFYQDILGVSVGFRPQMDFPGYWLYLGDTPCIHIGEWKAYIAHSNASGLPVSARARVTGPVDHIAFNATDYEGVLAKLESRGIQFWKNTVPDIHLRQLFVEDPNGLRIELNFMPEGD